RLGKSIYKASSIKGAFELGRQVAVTQMKPVDLILCGSVAVRRNGARLGKGGGYSALEYGIALEARLSTSSTPVITTVHPLQVVTDECSLMPHDVTVDFIVTPDKNIDWKTRR